MPLTRFPCRVSIVGAALLVLAGTSPFSAGAQTRTTRPQTSAPKPKTTVSKQTAAKPTQTRTSLARARAASRARAAARARAARERMTREAMTPRFKRDELGNMIPDVRAAAAIVYDPQTNKVLWETNSHEPRSIASLTKIMTAVTFVADDPDLTQKVAVTRADLRNASVTYLKNNELISYADLLHLTLIASDNAATRVLARTSEGGTAAFVTRMNEMAAHLGLTNTRYTDPSGLDANNISSAYDLSQLIAFAAGDEKLGPVMRLAQHEVRTSSRVFTVHSTNKLLGTDVDVRGGKTGFISKAGYCLATLLRIPQGPQVSVVVLGASNSTTRFWEARHLFNWVVGRMQGLVGGDDETNQPEVVFSLK